MGRIFVAAGVLLLGSGCVSGAEPIDLAVMAGLLAAREVCARTGQGRET